MVESRRLDRLATGGERILFVDDEEALVALGQEALGHLGYKVVATVSSIDALKLFEQSPKNFDLIITNQTMPHMTGARLARKALTIRPGCSRHPLYGLRRCHSSDQSPGNRDQGFSGEAFGH